MFNSATGRVRSTGIAAHVSVCCVLLALQSPHIARAGPARASSSEQGSVERSIHQLQNAVPKSAAEYNIIPIEDLRRTVTAVDLASAELGDTTGFGSPEGILDRISRLTAAKEAVDQLLDSVLSQRVEFGRLEARDIRTGCISKYLQFASGLIDVSGRLHYELAAAIEDAAYQFASQPALRDELIDQLMVLRSGIGASIMSWALLDPPASSPNRAQPASPATKIRLLAMIAWSGRTDTLPVIAQFLTSGRATDELTICAAETIRQLGLPQDPRPGNESKLPAPAMTAVQLQRILSNLDARTLNRDLTQRRTELLKWLEKRQKYGVESAGFQVGRYTIRPGDWLLMRNSSPYNLFTSLAPGLFTHVSVVTMERDATGYQRMVVVEVTERARRIPANNVESVLDVPLYFAVLRHEEPAVARKMSEVAASLINNDLEYDMTFDTSHVIALAGKSLAGQKIKTYCAGLPLLCAQETTSPRQEFFPIPEAPASGRTVSNLSKLGLRFGHDLVSPTGSLFAPHMRIAGRSEPMYAPGREVEQGIFDHFATNMIDKEMVPTPNLAQSLRLRMAQASKTNPVLTRALAAVAGVNADTDLVTAAKTLAVIETLFEIADSNSRELLDALDAVYGGTPESFARMGRTAEEIDRIMTLRVRHAELRLHTERRQLSPRRTRNALVQYYTEQGKRQIDQRFFAANLE